MFFSKKKTEEENYKKIVIKYDEKTTSRYSIKTYNKYPFLANYIKKNEFNNILDKANIIIYDAKMKKAKFDKVIISNLTYLLIIVALLFTLIFTLLFYYAPRTKENRTTMKALGIIFFCASIIILLGLEGYNIFHKISGDKTLFDFYRDDIIKYLNEVNKEWKDQIIFNFDEKTKNLICKVKIGDKNSMDSNGNNLSKSKSIIQNKSHSRSKSNIRNNSNSQNNSNSNSQSNSNSRSNSNSNSQSNSNSNSQNNSNSKCHSQNNSQINISNKAKSKNSNSKSSFKNSSDNDTSSQMTQKSIIGKDKDSYSNKSNYNNI
jgi:hypothetical protein